MNEKKGAWWWRGAAAARRGWGIRSRRLVFGRVACHSYTVLGARQLLSDAGLEIVHTQRMGDSMITSGYMLGFGAGDYAASYLEEHMLAEVGENVQWLQRKPNALHMNVGVVARKPHVAM